METARKKSATGEIDGGRSGDVRLTDDLLDEDEGLIDDEPSLDDLDELTDDGDSSPGDRRRDPLRRPI